MTTDRLQVRREGDLVWVTLDDPKRANALAPELLDALTEVYGRDWRSEGVRGLLLSAAGRHFSAGADLAHLESLQRAGPEENLTDSRRLAALFSAVLSQEVLTVALVHGACVAGGCGLATAHDFVFAADDARFMYSEVRIGFVAALVATFLRLRVRGSELRELLLAPEFIAAERAREIGLVNRVVARASLEEAGRAFAIEVLTNASSESIARTKRLLLELPGRSIEDALEVAIATNAESRATADCQRGIGYFLEHKRAPTWRE